MDTFALVAGVGGFGLGLITGSFGVWQFWRYTRENPSVLLTVRHGDTPGEYVLANFGFRAAYAVDVKLVSMARSTTADVITTEHWQHIQE